MEIHFWLGFGNNENPMSTIDLNPFEILILSKKMSKPDSKKNPIFYWITDKGKKWVADYLKNFPQIRFIKEK